MALKFTEEFIREKSSGVSREYVSRRWLAKNNTIKK